MFKFIIPTYKRHKVLLEKTLKYLEKTDIDFNNVYIYVANEEEKKLYEENIPKKYYKEIVVGLRGIPQQRNFIYRTHPIGERIFMMDDDIKSLVRLPKGTLVTNLTEEIDKAFDLCEELGLKYWGFYLNTNPLNYKVPYSVGLYYISGNSIGTINNDKVFRDEGEECPSRKDYRCGKESHEMCLKHFQEYKGVLRVNYIGVESEYWKTEGGHQVSRTNEGEKEASEWLHKKFPRHTKLIIRKSGIYDLQFVNRR